MRTYLRRCPSCGGYTLRETCPKCDVMSAVPAPARFSPEDRYGAYRRRLKRRLEAERNG
ncbi:MAG: RNA-protein complex protein Nop10 [Euryarchaeota archaeon]|nr:RNA-protein complex protein Nop10 [Euryarchaeota archaeon]